MGCGRLDKLNKLIILDKIAIVNFLLPMVLFTYRCYLYKFNMGDSDEEYDRRRGRDKFRRERNDYDRRDDRRGGREPWDDRQVLSVLTASFVNMQCFANLIA